MKTLVIGLDGATFRVLDPLIEQGRLPHISGLIREGVRGRLLSTVPPISPTAWTSLVTGKDPGKHGIYNFTHPAANSYCMDLVNSFHRKAQPIWMILGEAGKKVGVMNVPVTYPPDKVNGFLISGMYGPAVDAGGTYPEALYREIGKELNLRTHAAEDSLFTSLNYSNADQTLKNIDQMVEGRAKAFKYLMKRYPADFFMLVFAAPDWIQHFFWHCMDSRHPRYDEKNAASYRNVIYKLYEKMDSVIGELLREIEEETAVVVVSDHGMGPLDNLVPYLNLNDWLRENGFLAFNGRRGNKVIFNAYQAVRPLLRGILSPGMRSAAKKVKFRMYFSFIDWENTYAYVSFEERRSFWIRINLKNREPNGIVEPKDYDRTREILIKKLKGLRHPSSGEEIVEKVYKKEELYHGHTLDSAPDLIIQWKEKAFFLEGSGKEAPPKEAKRAFRPRNFSLPKSGDHRAEGVFIIKGPNIHKDKNIGNINIVDIAPTILYLMGQPIPADMDGRLLREVFSESFINRNPAAYVEKKGAEDESGTYTYSGKELEKTKERLRSLGYLE